MINWNEKFAKGLSYEDFLDHFASEGQRKRWESVQNEVQLTDPQKQLLSLFQRHMKVLCLAGAWCGDCINQCPIFVQIARHCPLIDLRFLDRDEHADVQAELRINAGDRIPVVVFLSEDGHEVARYGERTLTKYRQLVLSVLNGTLPPSIATINEPILAPVTQEWLNEFERVQWLLRLSPRLRQMHCD